MSAEHFGSVCTWEITLFFFLFDYGSKICAEMHFASAADHTTDFLHSYPIKQIKLWDSENHLINFYRVWWQGKVEHGVRIMLLVRRNGLDRDKISWIALNSSGRTGQGQKNAFAEWENVIAACAFVWLCVHGLQLSLNKETQTKNERVKQGKNPPRGILFTHFPVKLHLFFVLLSVSAELHMSPPTVQPFSGSVWICARLFKSGLQRIRRVCWAEKT